MIRKLCLAGVALLLINSALLAGFPSDSLFEIGNVLLHIVLGAVVGLAALYLSRVDRTQIGVALAALSGVILAFVGNTHNHFLVFLVHVIVSLFAAAAFLARRDRIVIARWALSLAAVLLAIGLVNRFAINHPQDRIVNAGAVPESMNQEGGGPGSPLFPSGAKTADGKLIPSGFFMESQKCGECHRDIYNQWKRSMHHFASFNNQFYRKSIEYMQDVDGVKPSKWCAGCHDHALFFNGRFDRPMKEQIDTPEAQAGLSCMSCHSVVHVNGSMGNNDFTMAYPPLHEIADSSNLLLKKAVDFVTYAAPEAHRATFLKPFMKNKDSVSQYCSTCHKVHLDVPVNNYRWVRGFNDYDNWQASGVSGQGARSFYYPPKSLTCADCHMPMVKSHDPGNIDGLIHSHSFPGANTAVPFVDNDHVQMGITEKFLKSGFITVDIFGISPVKREKSETEMIRRGGNTPQTQSTFAVGEEAEQTGAAMIRDVGQIAAPIDKSGLTLESGSTDRIDVVVRTRKIGHFFPGGTVDAFDVWLELKAVDDTGKPIFWSGKVEDNGHGPVEPGAHFYRSYQLDGGGNPINKRNAWQTRSVLYVHLIPPGAADVAHYLVTIPKDAKGQIHFTAKLNYRKFSWYYTQFAYAGKPKPNQDPHLLAIDRNALDYDFSPANIPADVSGNLKGAIPSLPIITVAQAEVAVPIANAPSIWQAVSKAGTRERWNDWGIGLLLQGDLKGAEYAFRKAAEADPNYADAYLNVARALIQEGETDAAKPYLEKALAIDSSLGRIYYFKALVQKSDGDYDGALQSLQRVAAQYPRDRVVLNQIARILFLKRQFADAVTYLQRVSAIDPEDVQMHYTAMLCYRGLGQTENARHEQILFERFKADESSQAITGIRRLASPEDNNEAQAVHDHESVPLP